MKSDEIIAQSKFVNFECYFCVTFTRNFSQYYIISFSFRCRRWAFSYFWGKSRMCCNVILVFVVKAGSSSSITSERSSSDTSSQQSFHVTRINTFWATIATFNVLLKLVNCVYVAKFLYYTFFVIIWCNIRLSISVYILSNIQTRTVRIATFKEIMSFT